MRGVTSRFVLPAVLLVAACGGSSREEPAPAAASTAMPAPPAAVDSAGFDTSRVSIPGTTRGVVVHDGASVEDDRRLVLSFRGDSTPALDVSYAAGQVVQCGSGEAVPVVGAAVLHIRMSPVDAHEFDGERAVVTVQERQRRLDGPLLTQLTMTCDFEAQVEWVVGLSRRAPFRVGTSAAGDVAIEFLP